ncbi:MAG TPA: IS110 family transposase [Alcaligenaceae bacterium]|nr:IS110 family transposase [Alcaligenaceae bacterium]
MNSIIYVGMDVHKESFSVCCYTFDSDKIQYQQKLDADYRQVLKYLEQVRKRFPNSAEIVCGYEAGCLGYSLYHQLTDRGVKCIILAPTTMGIMNTNRVKTDRKDAGNVAKCLAFGTYKEVYVPTDEDNAVKEFIRMRDDQKKLLKSTKQQILALVLRHGKRFEGGKTYWTMAHVKWLKSLELPCVVRETLDEYLITYEYLSDKVQRLDLRIEEIASGERYEEEVKKLSCFIGIKAHTALSAIVEVGDFKRFAKAEQFASYLGLVPSEDSSGDSQKRYGITKAGNSHLRRLLVEAAQGYTRGQIGHKSLALKKRQEGNSPQVIAYADKANERLRRRFYRMTLKNGIKRNVATTAIARELACFIWGMMTDQIA